VVQNRDHCFTGRGAPHFGHRLGASRMDVASNSNSWPHRLHRYSKMGMVKRARVQASNGLAVRRHVEHGPLSGRGFLHKPCQLRRMTQAQISVGPGSGGRNDSQGCLRYGAVRGLERFGGTIIFVGRSAAGVCDAMPHQAVRALHWRIGQRCGNAANCKFRAPGCSRRTLSTPAACSCTTPSGGLRGEGPGKL